eukprot:1468833-Rhodomonas_salina.1
MGCGCSWFEALSWGVADANAVARGQRPRVGCGCSDAEGEKDGVSLHTRTRRGPVMGRTGEK